MVQKQAVRSRSKSASRKSKVENDSGSNPIVTSRRKSTKIEENKNDKDSDTAIHTYRRITRQSFRSIASSSTNDINPDEPFVSLEDIVHGEAITNQSINKESSFKEGNSKIKWCNALFKAIFSLLFVIVFPLLVILFNKMCENGGTMRLISLNEFRPEYFTNWVIIALVFVWLFFLSLLSILPIGSSRSVPLSDGFKLRYRCNGILSMVISTVGLLWLMYSKYLTTKMVYDNYYELIGSSITLAMIISLLVFLKSYIKKCELALHSGNVPYCYLMGREINPRILGLDLKYFYEFRPGLISWALLNVIFCIKDFEDHEYKSINMSLLLCASCQFIYCFDSLLFEGDVILKSFMVSGQFGFIHCFGSQVIVPFLFTLTSRVIQINKLQLPGTCLTCIAILNFVGYVIYRSSNSQKNEFRRNPYSVHLTHLKTITTENGQQLLAGGWWGLLRHPNYVGDIIMSICWSLCAGSCLAICWLYPLYFSLFIVNRCVQDERYCAHKHGRAWAQYKSAVRYRLLPFIF